MVEGELSSNNLLSANQRKALETAISFVDQISRVPPGVGDRGTWSRGDNVDIDLSQNDILHIILGGKSHVLVRVISIQASCTVSSMGGGVAVPV